MTDFVKICPKCGHSSPEYENLCGQCGHFIGMELAQRRAEAAAEPARPEPKPASDPVSQQAPRQSPPLALRLSIPGTALSFGVRSGDLLGQAHPDSPAQIQLPATLTDVAYVHRRHCRFVQESGQWWLQIVDQAELGSAFTNPSWLNGVRLQPGERRPLGHGDDLRLAGVTLLLSFENSLEPGI